MKKMSILFVDDERDLLENYSFLFETEASTIEICDNPLEALERLNRGDIDICFLDYRMPELNGLELREQVDESNTIFYLVTGELDLQETPGFEKVLRKPSHFDEVESIIRNFNEDRATKAP
jgi:DNA-binding NtrC family response regulator